MGIDRNLQAYLDKADPDELIDVIFVLKASSVSSGIMPVDPSNIRAGRNAFANNARRILTDVIDEASHRTGKTSLGLELFERMASARLRVPVDLIESIAAHPAVATIGLATD